MNINKHQQRGLSGMTIMFLLIILIVILVVFFKLFPLYMDDWKVADVLEKIKEQDNVTQKNDNEIRSLFLQYSSGKDLDLFDKDNVKQHVDIQRDDDEIEMIVKYQRIKPLMGKISFLVEFEQRIEIP